MKFVRTIGMTILIVMAAGVASARETHPGGLFNNCAGATTDSDGFYVLQNDCGETLTFTYGTLGGSRAGYAQTIYSGGSQGTGILRKLGQLSIAVCREDYMPEGASGSSWRPGTQYRCVRY